MDDIDIVAVFGSTEEEARENLINSMKSIHNELGKMLCTERTIRQPIGLVDSKGVVIYKGDTVRINISHDEYPQYSFDGLYEVHHCFRGVSFKYIKLAWVDEDTNQYPIRVHITSEYIYDKWHDKAGCHYTEMSDGKEIKSISIEVVSNV